MFKFIFSLFLLIFLVSCGGTNATIKKQDKCQRDSTIICSKDNAPVLEKMSESDIKANIKMFGAAYKNKDMVRYMKTDVSKLDQCISVYQYYNCKAYCESDTITKEEKVKKDQEIVKECTRMMKKEQSDTKELQKDISKKKLGNRIYINFVAEEGSKIDEKLKKIIYLAFKEKATETTGKYVIIDDAEKQKTWDRIIKERKWSQNDPRFLPELQKQLAANIMIKIIATPMGSKLLLTNEFFLLEKSVGLKTKNLIYTPTPAVVDDFDAPAASDKLKADKIYEAYSKLAEDFFKSLDN